MRRLLLVSFIAVSGCTATQLSHVSREGTDDRVRFSTEGESSTVKYSGTKSCDAECQRLRQEELARLQGLHEPVASEATVSSLLIPEPESAPALGEQETSMATARADALKPPASKGRAKKTAQRPK
jgi:hypothetical protein